MNSSYVRATALIVAAGAISGPAMAADPMMPSYSPPPVYQAEPMVTGQLQLYGGVIEDWLNDSSGIIGGRGSANVMLPHHTDIRAQFDLIGLGLLDSSSSSTVLALAHFYKLAPGQHAFGVFAGGGSAGGSGAFVGGLEGQWFWGPITVGGDVAYWSDSLGSSDSAVVLNGYLSYYITDATKVTGRVGYAARSGGTTDTLEVAGRLDHRYANSPFGAFGEIAWIDHSGGGGDGFKFIAGLNIDIDGGGSRLTHDRSNTLWNYNPVGGY